MEVQEAAVAALEDLEVGNFEYGRYVELWLYASYSPSFYQP